MSACKIEYLVTSADEIEYTGDISGYSDIVSVPKCESPSVHDVLKGLLQKVVRLQGEIDALKERLPYD